MTQDEIIEMASEAAKGGERMAVFTLFELKAFAELVAAKATAVEREACAKVCDEFNFGQSPMMGIISANIKTETKGSLKTATIQIKAFNKVQFDIIDNLYMRLGYSVLLEFGYSHYFQDTGLNGLDQNRLSLENEYFSGTNDYYSFRMEEIQ